MVLENRPDVDEIANEKEEILVVEDGNFDKQMKLKNRNESKLSNPYY